MSKGWAIQQDGEILVESVSPTRIAAIVNWLIVKGGVAVLRDTPDSFLNAAFESAQEVFAIEAIEVDITKVLHS